MLRELIQNIGQKVERKLTLEPEPEELTFFERCGVIVSSPVNGAICRSLHPEPSGIETLTESVNDIFEQIGPLESFRDFPVGQEIIRKQLGAMSKRGIVEQNEEGKWFLTKSGQEVTENLMGKPRTKEQKLIDTAELIGAGVLDLKGSSLRKFVQNFRRFLPIIKASISRDTTGPFEISSNKKIVDEAVRNLREAWENFEASSGRTGHPD